METPDTVLKFWFGSDEDDAIVADQRSKLWWSKNPDTDNEIRQRFEPLVAKATAGELNDWLTSPRTCLALILLADQFPRNIYRDTAKAFAFDPLALAWSKDGIRHGMHELLRPIERVFFYLPLEHSESKEDQQQSVSLFQELADHVTPAQKAVFAGFLDFAIRHRDIVERFGRFPHRNQLLGRESTPEELSFLKERGSSF